MAKKTILKPNLVQLSVGMYIARLTEDLEDQYTVLSVAPNVGQEQGTIDFFHSDGDEANNQLTSPKQSIIVRVRNKESALLLTSSLPNGADEPSVKIDRIAVLGQKASSVETKKTLASVAEKIQKLQQKSKAETAKIVNDEPHLENKANILGKVVLIGHVEWKGDIRVDADDWLGDPTSKTRIEGFAIGWQNKPIGVDLAYTCQVKNMGKTPIALSGSYVGTRRKSLPITALTLSLVGINALNYTLHATVVFADGEEQSVLSGVECQGVTGNEQLVALKVAVLKKQQLTKSEQTESEIQFQSANNSQWTVHSV